MNWFIIQGKDHLGPFTEDFIRKMFEAGELRNESQLWQEGMEAPDSLYKLLIKKKEPWQELIPEEEQLPPPLPSVSAPVPVVKEVEVKVEEIPPQRPVVAKPKLVWPYYVIICLCLVAAGIGAITYYQLYSPPQRPLQLSFNEYTRLVRAMEEPDKGQDFAMAMARDKSRLWLSLPNLNSGPVGLKIESVPGKILAEENIVAEGLGSLEQRMATFEHFNFQEGTRLIDGYYRVEFFTLSPLKVPLLKRWGNADPQQFKYSAEILITSLTQSQFEKALQELKQKKAANDHSFWNELLQKYSTLKAITGQIRESLLEIFADPRRWKEKVQTFENDYKLNYGQFFTNFVIANNESYAALTEQTFSDKVEIIANYTRLSALARNVGGHTMSILHELEAFQQTRDQMQLLALKEKSLEKLDSIIAECDQMITHSQDK